MPDKTSLHDLGLTPEPTGDTPFESIPENLGQSFPDPIQPGTYRFRFPVFQVTSPIWEKIDTKVYGTRISATFEDGFALTIVQSPNKAHDGEDYRLRISNVPRERGKDKILVSDMAMLLKALGQKTPKDNAEWARSLASLSGREFTAVQEFSWRCSPDRDIYVEDGTGGTQQVEGKPGCGQRYYQRDVQKVDGAYPIRITCANPECGASIRAFGNLSQFKA